MVPLNQLKDGIIYATLSNDTKELLQGPLTNGENSVELIELTGLVRSLLNCY
jgi:hypothetical protein